MENKIRTASVERINDLLGRGALKFRKGVMQGDVWMMGYNAASSGTPIEGSRLLWEIQNWSYPKPAAGVAQKQDPDDNTADGADAIASMRYAIMSWWKAGRTDKPQETLREAKQRIAQEAAYDSEGDKKLEQIAKKHDRERKQLERLVKRMRSA